MTNSPSGTGTGASPRAVVAGHGDFAAGVISAVQQIVGTGNVFRGVNNAALDAAGLERAIAVAVADSLATVVFTDLPGGSCTIAARRVARASPGLAVVTGANLAMLLDFALNGAAAAAAEHAAEKGRAAIIVVEGMEDARAH